MAPASAHQSAATDNAPAPNFIRIPREVRLEILRYCLRTDRNRDTTYAINKMSRDEFLSKIRDREDGEQSEPLL